MFDQFALPPQAAVLEVGCGPGNLWRDNLGRIPPGWAITLTDFSPGMLEQARQNLAASGRPFAFEVADVQALPFPDNSFDAMIAMFMLQHVPDRTRAFGEIRRVLRPGGTLYAATFGRGHLRELHELLNRFVPGESLLVPPPADSFLLETGAAELSPWFNAVSLHGYDDALHVTEAEPLLAYVRSSPRFAGDDMAGLAHFVEAEIATHGAIRISKENGLFVASNPGIND
ncbi:MAG: class I SAM-dependent methyltransferase [Chloroflexaceae bacterium]|nr:class I SAM-dependent methyltransferase [Chloroflexaceae bacterium]